MPYYETKCVTPPPGYFVSSPQYSKLDYCPTGKFATTSTCRDCANGRYCPTSDQELACPAGFYCDNAKSEWPILCHIRNRCPGGSSGNTPCAANGYSMYGESACKTVTEFDGHYQGDKTQYIKAVDPGKSGWQEIDCLTEEYCIYGESNACPVTFSSEGLKFYCIQCPFGSACLTPTSAGQRLCGNDTRRHSRSGYTECFNCNRSKSCEHRNQYFPYSERDLANPLDQYTYELDCPIGTYSGTYNISCHDATRRRNYCPFGFRTTNISGIEFNETVEQGCTIHNLHNSDPLPNGRQKCVTGTYTTHGFPYCLVSPPGYISERENNKLFDNKDLCLKGYYCSLDFDHRTSSFGLKTARCPHGSYANDLTGSHTMEENCEVCPPGYRCPGNSDKEKCKDGYICELGVIKESVRCPSGFYYAKDVDATTKGTYELCLQCPKGKVCDYNETEGPAISNTGGADLKKCPVGHRCGLQTSNPQAYPSNPGYYIGQEETVDQAEVECPINAYCPSGSEKPIICPVSS